MWPFKKKAPPADRRLGAVAKLKAFRDIGEEFNFLGRRCVVTAHTELVAYAGVVPLLKFCYVDDHGVLHSAAARVAELPALIAQQKATGQ